MFRTPYLDLKYKLDIKIFLIKLFFYIKQMIYYIFLIIKLNIYSIINNNSLEMQAHIKDHSV